LMISLSGRLKVNLESLNGVETVGNFARHRTAPIIVHDKQNSFQVRYVPVVSGESIAHGYQTLLVDICKQMGLPIGVYSSRYEFIKFSEDNYLSDEGISPPRDYDDMQRFEVDVLTNDVVADVGGFLYTGDYSVKRTSRIHVGYMIPALKDTDAAALEAQFHVRYLQSKPQKGAGQQASGTQQAKLGQSIFNVEVASAIYTLNANLDVDEIAVPSIKFGKPAEQSKLSKLENQKVSRKKAAILALGQLFSSMKSGAKLSRFLPNSELLSIVVTETSFPFSVSPGNGKDYISATIQRVEKASEMHQKAGISVINYKVHVVDNENALTSSDSSKEFVSKHSNVEELFTEVLSAIK